MTTLRALTIIALAVFIGWVCVADQVPDLAGVVALIALAVFAVTTPHVNERMSR